MRGATTPGSSSAHCDMSGCCAAPRAPMLRDMVHLRGATSLGSVIAAAEAASPVQAVESVTRELGRTLEASEASFLIADLSGRALVRLAHVPLRPEVGNRPPRAQGERRDAGESATVLPFDGGPEEKAIRVQQVQVLGPEHRDGDAQRAGHWRVLAPVTERGEAIGLLELFLPREPGVETVAEIAQLAHLLAFVVIANRRHTDLYEWGQRTRPLSLSAEIQHRLLAGPQTCEAGAFTLAGWLEPAAEIAGDTFDFSLARDELHLSITDAMGHGVAAALNATLCVGSLRNTRNEGALLLDQVTTANQALAAHAISRGLEDFVTGLVGRLDLRAGSIELVNAGHVAPYLARGSTVTPIELPVDLPLGLFPDAVYRSTKVVLENGDRLVLVTDGMLERHAAELDLAQEIRASRSLHPRETVRALADCVLEVVGGELSDDATVLCLDWYGGHGHDRSSRHGADPALASPPHS
ncbi:PP2C family protein-serine/threonine phosphatase [Oryzihumus sp.]